MKSYSEMLKFKTFEERFNYLKLQGRVGEETFGTDRYLNQLLYSNPEWRRLRRDIIIRDDGCDLAISDRQICPDVSGPIPRTSNVYIHHINPLTREDVINHSPKVFDPENVVCVSFDTHQAIHYGDSNLLAKPWTPRRPNDTCPWRCV